MRNRIYVLMALLVATCLGSATLVDLGDYILSTGDQYVTPELAFGNTNNTTGVYCGIAAIGKNSDILIALVDDGKPATLNETNLTAAGYKKVTKPYPGYLLTNSTTDEVTYQGVTKNLTITMLFKSYQAALNLLPNMQVISRKDYQEVKSEQLLEKLS